MTLPPSRPALLPLDHPLSYSTSKRKHASLGNGSEALGPGEVSEAGEKDLGALLQRVLDRQDIVNLLNEYAYVLDTVMVNPEVAQDWAALFTMECSVNFPFGHFSGRESLADMCLKAESRFERMIHMSSNFSIVFESDVIAHGRSALFAVCGLDPSDIGKNFAEGGYYYWTFRKEQNQEGQKKWKISYLYLDVTWSQGDSLGLNEPRHQPPFDDKQASHAAVNEIIIAPSIDI